MCPHSHSLFSSLLIFFSFFLIFFSSHFLFIFSSFSSHFLVIFPRSPLFSSHLTSFSFILFSLLFLFSSHVMLLFHFLLILFSFSSLFFLFPHSLLILSLLSCSSLFSFSHITPFSSHSLPSCSFLFSFSSNIMLFSSHFLLIFCSLFSHSILIVFFFRILFSSLMLFSSHSLLFSLTVLTFFLISPQIPPFPPFPHRSFTNTPSFSLSTIHHKSSLLFAGVNPSNLRPGFLSFHSVSQLLPSHLPITLSPPSHLPSVTRTQCYSQNGQTVKLAHRTL